MIASIALIVFLSNKQGDKILSGFYEDYEGLRQKQDEKAKLAEAESLIKKNPKSGEGYAKRAEYFKGQGEYETALKDYNRAIALDPGKAEWYYARGHVRDSSEPFEDVIGDYTKAIELKPQSQYYFDRAEVYKDNDEYAKALSDFDLALKLGYPAATVYERKGEVFAKTAELDKAIEEFKKSLLESPEDDDFDGNSWETKYSQTRAHRELSNVYVALNDFDSALNQVADWIKQDESDEDGYFARARLYEAMGDSEKKLAAQTAGVACLTKQIEDYPSGYRFKARADAYTAMGKTEEANADRRKAIEFYKKEIQEEGLAKDYYKSEVESLQRELDGAEPDKELKKDIEKEIAESSKKIAAKPKDAELYSERASLYYDAHKSQLALRDYETARKLDPADSAYAIEIGRILIAEKRYDDATAEYSKLAEGSESKNPWVYTKMAQAFELAGKHEEAIKAANKSIELDPLLGNGYYWRSKALEGSGDKEKAKNSMAQAIFLEFDVKDFE